MPYVAAKHGLCFSSIESLWHLVKHHVLDMKSYNKVLAVYKWVRKHPGDGEVLGSNPDQYITHVTPNINILG